MLNFAVNVMVISLARNVTKLKSDVLVLLWIFINRFK